MLKRLALFLLLAATFFPGMGSSAKATSSLGTKHNFLVYASDSLELIKNYSLFSEYYKNRDYESSLPYGWIVLKLNPARFANWIYDKMEHVIWYFRDTADISPERKKIMQDTIIYLYDLAIKYNPKFKGYYQARKAFVEEVWLERPAKLLISEYETAFKYDSTLLPYYYHRLGQLYKNNAADDNDYKTKALDIYTYLSEREPDNPQWNTELEGLVDNIDQLVDLAKKAWDLKKDDQGKAWKYASLAIRANEFKRAIEPLEFLASKAPDNINYLNQLASTYHKLELYDKAVDTYKKLIALEPDKKEHYFNIGIIYKDRNLLAQARAQFMKANDIANGWAQAVFYEGTLYEQSARSCGTFEFMDKCVYQLAVDTYRKALSIDPSFNQAKDRIAALAGSVPEKQDYFFRNYKSGQVIQINGPCYGWIGRSITVP